MHAELVAVHFDLQLLISRLLILRRRDVTEIMHALQNVLLPRSCAFGVDDGIVCRRCLGQASQHCSLRDRNVREFFSKIDLCGRCKTVRTLTEVDLVHVQLENLVFGQCLFNFPGQQHLVQLALDGLFTGEKEISCDLLSDGRGTLAAATYCIVNRGAKYAPVVNPPVFIEAIVLDGQHGLLHDFGDVLVANQATAFLAKLTNQHIVCREHAQRHLGLIGGQRIDIRQVRIRHHHHEADEQHTDDSDPGEQAEQAEGQLHGRRQRGGAWT